MAVSCFEMYVSWFETEICAGKIGNNFVLANGFYGAGLSVLAACCAAINVLLFVLRRS